MSLCSRQTIFQAAQRRTLPPPSLIDKANAVLIDVFDDALADLLPQAFEKDGTAHGGIGRDQFNDQGLKPVHPRSFRCGRCTLAKYTGLKGGRSLDAAFQAFLMLDRHTPRRLARQLRQDEACHRLVGQAGLQLVLFFRPEMGIPLIDFGRTRWLSRHRRSLSERHYQIDMTDAQSDSQFVQGDNGRVTPPLFEATDVLLAEPGNFRELLLGQPLLGPDPFEIPADEHPHVHAAWSAERAGHVYQLYYVFAVQCMAVSETCTSRAHEAEAPAWKEGHEAMDPFRNSVWTSPAVEIHGAAVQGYVVPNDGGTSGLFVYRNNALLSAGGWLDLDIQAPSHDGGNLARIRIDVPDAALPGWFVEGATATLSAATTDPLTSFAKDIIRRTCPLPLSVRYVKNGRGGRWWKAAKNNNQVHGGWSHVPAELLRNPGGFSAIRQKIEQDPQMTDPGAQKRDFNQLRDLLDNPSKHVWVTFEDGYMWWCMVEDEITAREMP